MDFYSKSQELDRALLELKENNQRAKEKMSKITTREKCCFCGAISDKRCSKCHRAFCKDECIGDTCAICVIRTGNSS